jgi:hypothetical protein
MNIEEALLAAVEQRPIAGIRRSTRLHASAPARHEQAVLAIIQEEEIQSGLTE